MRSKKRSWFCIHISIQTSIFPFFDCWSSDIFHNLSNNYKRRPNHIFHLLGRPLQSKIGRYIHFPYLVVFQYLPIFPILGFTNKNQHPTVVLVTVTVRFLTRLSLPLWHVSRGRPESRSWSSWTLAPSSLPRPAPGRWRSRYCWTFGDATVGDGSRDREVGNSLGQVTRPGQRLQFTNLKMAIERVSFLMNSMVDLPIFLWVSMSCFEWFFFGMIPMIPN